MLNQTFETTVTTSAEAILEHLSLFSSPARLRAPAFTVINRMDGKVRPAEQVLGTAVALAAMAETLGIPMRELITRAERAMKDVDSCGAEHIKAIRMFADQELRRKPR